MSSILFRPFSQAIESTTRHAVSFKSGYRVHLYLEDFLSCDGPCILDHVLYCDWKHACRVIHNSDPCSCCSISNLMAMLATLWLSLCLFLHITCALNASSPVVDLGYSIYQGTFNATSNITRFLGIRYAAPPVGSYPCPLSRCCDSPLPAALSQANFDFKPLRLLSMSDRWEFNWQTRFP